jgi:hypothetical protein
MNTSSGLPNSAENPHPPELTFLLFDIFDGIIFMGYFYSASNSH